MLQRKRLIRACVAYGCCIVFIGLWWWLAFFGTTPPSTPLPRFAAVKPHVALPDRALLSKALQGDFAVIGRLLERWDREAERAAKRGITGLRRLPRETLLAAEKDCMLLLHGSEDEIAEATKERLCPVQDDSTSCVFPSVGSRYIAQTYSAATFLLACLPPEQIVAIPTGMRCHPDLYPGCDAIPCDADVKDFERWALYEPRVAFVAGYSHPTTLAALKVQEVPLFDLSKLCNIEEIQSALRRVSTVVGKPLQGDLLATFMTAAMMAIDNAYAVHLYEGGQVFERPLYMSYFSTFSLPAADTVAGELTRRLGFRACPDGRRELSPEDIVAYNPDLLVVSCAELEAMQKMLSREPAFQEIEAVKKQHVCYVDERLQNSPTQLLILAYYDLVDACMGGPS